MAKYSQTIEYNLRTTLDDSGIAKLQSEIRQVQNEIQRLSSMEMLGKTQVSQATAQLEALSNALNKSYNANLGMLDTKKFTSQMNAAKISMTDLNSAFNLAGTQGQLAFNNLVGRLGKLDTGIQSVSKTTDKLFNTIGNTVRWGVVASGFQQIMNSAHAAVQYMQDLDASLTNIMLVSDYTKEDMREFAQYANEAAAALGNTTVAYTDAALIYAQQGYGLEDQKKLADLTLKVSNVTGQESGEVSDQITAVVNGYKLSVEEATTAFDKLAEVANVSAADVEELAKAEAKVASTANTLGVSQDQLASQIATIVSVTREAPENVGNALKTIYARLGDLQMGETLEDGTTLGELSGLLDSIGVQVLDSTGNMRNMGDVMEDLMSMWSGFDRGTQQSLASTLAGKYQMNRFMTLMDNAQMYNEYLEASMNSAGTLEEMQGEYLDSLQGKLSTLQATFEGFLSDVFNQDDFGIIIDGLTNIINLFDGLIESVGGGGAALTAFGSIATKVFSSQISQGLNNFISNRQNDAIRKSNAENAAGMLAGLGLSDISSGRNKDLINFAKAGALKQGIMSEEQQNAYNAQLEKTVQIRENLINTEEKLEQAIDKTILAYKKAGYEGNIIKRSKDENGFLKVDVSELSKGLVDKDFELTSAQLEKMGGFSEYRQEIISTAQELSKLQEKVVEISNHGGDINQFFDQFSKGEMKVENLIQTLSLTEERAESLRNAFNSAFENGVVGGETADIQKFIQYLQEAINLTNKLNGFLGAEQVFNDSELMKLYNQMLAAIEADNANTAINRGMIAGLDSQEKIDNIITVTSSIGDLAFAWQSFQSLGSIWQNADLDSGEKLEQTILNIAMTAPTMIYSFSELKNVGTNLKNAANGAKTFGAALGGILSSTPALLGIAAAIGAISFAWGQYQENIQRTIDLQNEAATEAANVFNTGQESLNNFNALYEQYRTTGEATEELKAASESLAEALNLSGGNALIAAGNYDALAEAAEKASEKQRQQAIEAEKTKINGWIAKDLNGTDLGDVSSEVDYKKTLGSIGTTESYKTLADYAEKSIDEQIGALVNEKENLNNAISKWEDELKKLDKNDANYSVNKEQIEKKISQAQSDVSTIDGLLSSESWSALQESLYNISTLKQVDTSNLSSVQDIVDKYYSDEDFSRYFTQIGGDYVDVLDTIIAKTTDEAQKALLEVEKAKTQLGRQAYFATGSDEEAAKIVNEATESLTNEQLITFVGQLDENESFSNFSSSLEKFKNSEAGRINLTADIDEDRLNEAIEKKSSLNSLVETYQENGSFTEDEVANIVSENPDYLAYLTKVGDSYQLNRNALIDWNNAVEEQTAELERAQGAFNSAYFDDYQDALTKMQQGLLSYSQDESLSSDESASLESMSKLVESINSTSTALENGEISVEDYFNSYQEAFSNNNIDNIFSNLENYNQDVQKTILETSKILAEGLSDGINQANTQLKSGKISLTDYNKIMRKASETALDYQAGLKGLEKQGDKWVQTIDEEQDGIENLTDEQENWIKSNEDVIDSIDNSRAVEGIAQSLTDNYDYLSSIMDDMGNLTVPWESIIGTQQFSSVVNQMAAGISSFVTSSNANLSTFAAAMGMTSDQLIAEMGTDTSSIANYMLANQGNFESATQAMISGGAAAIGQVAQGASQVVAGLAEAISSFNVKITATPTDVGVERQDFTFDIFGKQFTASLPIPHFGVTFEGDGSGTAGISQIQSGLSTLSGGLSSLGSIGGAMGDIGLSDYAPGGSGGSSVPSSSFSNPGGSGGSGGSGGGGGGGGGGDTYEPQSKEKIEDDYNRYQKIDAALEDIAADFDMIANEQDRLTGNELTLNITKQISLLKQQINLQKEKLEIQQQEAQELKDRLSSEYGITFDENGFIQNYKDKYYQLFNEINSLIEQYNATTTEEGQKALEEQIEQRQEALDNYKELIDSYDELQHSSIKESLQNIEDYYDEIEDLQIEAFNRTTEAIEDIKDLNEAWAEFMQIGTADIDDPFREAETILAELPAYFDKSTQSAEEFFNTLIKQEQDRWWSTDDQSIKDMAHSKAEFYRQVLAEAEAGNLVGESGTGILDLWQMQRVTILDQLKQFEETGTSSIFGENSEALYEAAEEILNGSIDIASEYEQRVDDLKQSIIDSINSLAEEAEKRLEKYEAITEELEHQYNIVEMIQGDQSYDQLNAVLDAQNYNYSAQISELQSTMSYWMEIRDGLEEGSDQWEAVNEQILEVQSNINDLIEASLENLKQQYENTINKVLDTWTDDLFGTDIDWAAEQWELINRNADQYLDEVNAAYNIQKLQNKYLEMLDGSNDLHIQQQISEQMVQQLEYLREKDKLSQYDIEYANAQLEILQRQIALEEAQRNKSEMKLRRDSQGNYSYVYTANEEDVLSAENDLLDAENNAYNLSKDQIIQAQEDSLAAVQDAKDMLNQIWTDANLSLEEKQQRTTAILDSLREYMAGTSEQLSTSEKNIINDFIGMCESLTLENQGAMNEIYEQIINGNTDAFQQVEDRWNNSLFEWVNVSGQFESTTNTLYESLVSAGQNYKQETNKIAASVEQNFEDVTGSLGDCKTETDSLKSSTEDLVSTLETGAEKILGFQSSLEEYQKKLHDMSDENNALRQTMDELYDRIDKLNQENANLKNPAPSGGSSGGSSGGTDGSGGGSGGSGGGLTAGSMTGFTGSYYNDSWGTAPTGNMFSGQANAVRISSFSGTPYGNNSNTGDYKVHLEQPSGGWLGWVKPSQLFDTGGYTGSWEDGTPEAKNGKLAFLHQKELVLNQEDTINILQAVNAVRSMTENLKSGAFDAIISRLKQNGSDLINPDYNSKDLEQKLYIDAIFPNVKDASEIEQAILGLADQATQYVYRTK